MTRGAALVLAGLLVAWLVACGRVPTPTAPPPQSATPSVPTPSVPTPTSSDPLPSHDPSPGAAAMTVYLLRAHGALPGFDSLEVDPDGSVRLWRSRGASMAGRFTRTLTDEESSALQDAARAAHDEGSLEIPARGPGAAGDVVELADGVQATLPVTAQADGPWGSLVTRLRGLLDPVGSTPVAAIALEVDQGAARLVHRGEEPLSLDLAAASLHVEARDAAEETVASADLPLTEGGQVEVGPGWSLQLPSAVAVRAPAGGSLLVAITLMANDGQLDQGIELVATG